MTTRDDTAAAPRETLEALSRDLELAHNAIAVLREALAAQRERDARIAEAAYSESGWHQHYKSAAGYIAGLIRGQPPGPPNPPEPPFARVA
jgi:hypothetical protein